MLLHAHRTIRAKYARNISSPAPPSDKGLFDVLGEARRLAEQDSKVTGEKLSKATLHATLADLKRFFQWLAGQPGYRSKFSYSDADYFNLSDEDTRIATARREKKSPTIEQVKHLIGAMPSDSEIERRDRALVAFTLLTGARDSAIASMKLKHVDVAANCVYQDAREVKTKASKTFITYFFPVGDDIRRIVEDWVNYLRREKLWATTIRYFQPREWQWVMNAGSG